MRPSRIAIVGCGTAGAASALFLSRAGHEVSVFERVPDPGPVGAGIMIQPSGLEVLERLGLVAPILDRGAHVDRLLCENERGTRVVDLAYERLAPGLFGVGLHRGVLFETLFGAVRRSLVELFCGVGIDRVANGTLVTDTGDRLGPFDLVVVCDGARSHIRDGMHDVTKRVVPYPWGALWFIGDDPEDRYGRVLHQKVRGTRGMVGMLPTGKGPGGGSILHTSLFFSVRADEVGSWRAGGVAKWKDEVRSIAPEAEPLLEQIDDMDQLTFASYFDVTMPRWHAPGVVFLGDAAHATSPQLGQGCNLALYDAMILEGAMSDATSIAEALDLYTARRRDHLAFYQLGHPLADAVLPVRLQGPRLVTGSRHEPDLDARLRGARDGQEHVRDQDRDGVRGHRGEGPAGALIPRVLTLPPYCAKVGVPEALTLIAYRLESGRWVEIGSTSRDGGPDLLTERKYRAFCRGGRRGVAAIWYRHPANRHRVASIRQRHAANRRSSAGFGSDNLRIGTASLRFGSDTLRIGARRFGLAATPGELVLRRFHLATHGGDRYGIAPIGQRHRAEWRGVAPIGQRHRAEWRNVAPIWRDIGRNGVVSLPSGNDTGRNGAMSLPVGNDSVRNGAISLPSGV